jgi:3,4-dihydroxy 2-butanone 4-phosphate synthase/GTP cyclohydrolase II
MDTVEANVHLGFAPDPREYGIGAQILCDIGVTKFRIITNNPVKRAGLEGFGLQITGRVPILIAPNENNARYLRTKKEKLGHLLQ